MSSSTLGLPGSFTTSDQLQSTQFGLPGIALWGHLCAWVLLVVCLWPLMACLLFTLRPEFQTAQH